MTSKIGRRLNEPMPSKLSSARVDDRPSSVSSSSHEMRRAEKNSRKEVIQPQVLLQLPCYDFTPITDHTLGGFLSCESEHRLLVQPTFVM